MGVHLNEMERVDLLINLVESLNRGNSCDYRERVGIAKYQLDQILGMVKTINDEYVGAFH